MVTWINEDTVNLQVSVPVSLKLRMTRDDAESMLKDELCDVLDCVIRDVVEYLRDVENEYATDGIFCLCAKTEAMRQINVEWELEPHWDNLPDDECEISWAEEGLFPGRYDTDEEDDDGDGS